MKNNPFRRRSSTSSYSFLPKSTQKQEQASSSTARVDAVSQLSPKRTKVVRTDVRSELAIAFNVYGLDTQKFKEHAEIDGRELDQYMNGRLEDRFLIQRINESGETFLVEAMKSYPGPEKHRYKRRPWHPKKPGRVHRLVPLRLKWSSAEHSNGLNEVLLWDPKVRPYKDFVKTLAEEAELPESAVQPILDQMNTLLARSRASDRNRAAFLSTTPSIENRPLHIRINIERGRVRIVDEFAWDPWSSVSQLNDPEDFAHTLTADLGLTPGFATDIAIQIRQQVGHFVEEVGVYGVNKTKTPRAHVSRHVLFRSGKELKHHWAPQVYVKRSGPY